MTLSPYADACELARALAAREVSSQELTEAAIARIGISCRICSRLDCQQRAYPPNEKQISVDTSRRGAIPYEIT